ncbi:AI-2E family transporter, partial [Spirosoma sp.]|uniref:AI-2E family transporter n=1 Tax=Spirosoma sp. TaxID=1899569 RepID=UPI003B3A96B1
MDTRSPEVSFPSYAKITCVLISLVIIIYGLYVLEGLLIPLVFAILFAVLLFPMAQQLENWRIPRILAVVICLIVTLAALIGLFYAVSIQISNFSEVIPQFIKRGNAYIASIQTFADERLNIDRQRQVAEIRKYLTQALSEAGTIVTTTLLTTTSIITNIFLILLFAFFFLLYRDFFRSFFYKVLKNTRRSKIDSILTSIYEVVKDYLAGLVLVILII